jgi:hypothetical protein
MSLDIGQVLPVILFSFNGVIFLWLIVISVLFFKFKRHYNTLTGKIDKKNLEQVLKEILEVQNNYSKQYNQLKEEVETIENQGGLHLQKIGFKRFNPFKDTGGDQSFSAAILDEHKNGLVISSLHSREATRIYAKQVIAGTCKDMPLSKEEEDVVTSAKSAKL